MSGANTSIKIVTKLRGSGMVFGVVLVGQNQEPVAAVPLPGSWWPAPGDKLTITYKPQE